MNMIITDNDELFKMPEIDCSANDNIGSFSVDKKYSDLNGSGKFFKELFYDIQGVTLDKFKVDRSPAIIKLDVEGCELTILKGATQFLEKHSYPPILFEAWSESCFADGKEDLMGHFEHLG